MPRLHSPKSVVVFRFLCAFNRRSAIERACPSRFSSGSRARILRRWIDRRHQFHGPHRRAIAVARCGDRRRCERRAAALWPSSFPPGCRQNSEGQRIARIAGGVDRQANLIADARISVDVETWCGPYLQQIEPQPFEMLAPRRDHLTVDLVCPISGYSSHRLALNRCPVDGRQKVAAGWLIGPAHRRRKCLWTTPGKFKPSATHHKGGPSQQISQKSHFSFKKHTNRPPRAAAIAASPRRDKNACC
jgi:hypothetical protein